MRFRRNLWFVTLATLTSLVLSQTVIAQSERVVLSATVVNESGRTLPTLSAADFTVLVDNQPRKILTFNHEDAPMSVGILVDISGSVSSPSNKGLANVADGIEKLLQVGNPGSDYFVAAFRSKPGLVHEWTNDAQSIRNKLLPLELEGTSALYDGLYKTIEYVKTGRHHKKVIVVVSDGQDNASQHDFKDVREFLKESDVVLYAVVVVDKQSAGSALGLEGQGIFAELTKVSGGEALLVKGSSTHKTITESFVAIGTELRSQYDMSIEAPQALGSRRWHKLKLTATYTDAAGKPKQLKVRTREGFYR